MDLLIVEPLEAEVLQWLDARHDLFYAPMLPQDRRIFLEALADARAALVPPQAMIDAPTLSQCVRLRAIGRIAGGVDGLDMAACARSGVEVVRPTDAAAPAEAEFMLGALLALLRPSPEESHRVTGRELGACTVGLVGMTSAARTLARFLQPLGSRVIGYDPGVHASDAQWGRWGVQASGLIDLFEQADAVCVQLPYFSRYKGLLGERVLGRCRAAQVLVSISPLDLFDDNALAEALRQKRLGAAWLDSLDPGALSANRPLHGAPGLITTPRLGAYTREARVRSAWSVARRLDEILHTQSRGRRQPLSATAASLRSSARPDSADSASPADPAGSAGNPSGAAGAAAAAPSPTTRNTPPAADKPPAGTARSQRAAARATLTDTALPLPASPAEVMDIRALLPRASELDLRSPAASMPPGSSAGRDRLRVPPAPAVALIDPEARGPRRRHGEEHTLSRSND